MPIHPEAQALLVALDSMGIRSFEYYSVPGARQLPAGFPPLQGPAPDDVSVEERTIDTDGVQIPVRVYSPGTSGPRPAVVYFHGGGWVVGDLDTVDIPCRVLAEQLGAVVVSVGYRKAPEHRYPAAFDDAYAAVGWVTDRAEELGIAGERVFVMGDSAGANLAAGVALAARDRRGPSIAGQILLYPVTDFDFTTESYSENADGKLLTRPAMQWFWGHYLGAQDISEAPYATPARATDHSGLPPAFVATAECDPLRDEGQAYAALLEAAGTPSLHKQFDGMIHGFFWAMGALPSSAVVLDDVEKFVTSTVA